VWDAFRRPNLVNRRITRCAVVPSSTWNSTCSHIMVGLPPVIDCLRFFFLFSLLTTKVHNYLLFVCCLFESDMVCQTQTPWVWQPCLVPNPGVGWQPCLVPPQVLVWHGCHTQAQVWHGCQTPASWVWQTCATVLWTKTQSTVDLHSEFSKLWRLGIRLMLSFHIKLNYHFVLWLKKIEALIVKGISVFFIIHWSLNVSAGVWRSFDDYLHSKNTILPPKFTKLRLVV